MWFGQLFAQPLLTDTVAIYQDPPECVFSFESFEDVDWDEDFNIPFTLLAFKSTDLKGKIRIIDNEWVTLTGSDSIPIDTRNLDAGTYFVKVILNGEVQHLKLVIQ